MSANPALLSSNSPSYYFTTDAGNTYVGGNAETTNGVCGMIAGNTDACGVIDTTDRCNSCND